MKEGRKERRKDGSEMKEGRDEGGKEGTSIFWKAASYLEGKKERSGRKEGRKEVERR